MAHRAQGFEPLEDYPVTWEVLWDLWPAEHRIALPETRQERREPEWAAAVRPDVSTDVRLLRSPWPDVPLKRFIAVAYRQLAKKYPGFEYERDAALVAALARDLLIGGPQAMRARRRNQAGPTAT